MSNTSYTRAAMAHAALEFVSPSIRSSLLDEPEFIQEYGFRTEAVLAFGDFPVSFQRSKLFNAVRKALAGAAEPEVTDTGGREWKLRNEAATGELPKLVISSGDEQLVLPDLAVLSPEAAVRLRSLDEAAFDGNLPIGTQDTWRGILKERALADDEVDRFYSDMRDAPVHLMQVILREIRAGKSSVSSFVPSSRRYFERLVGAYDGSTSIRDYAAGTGKAFLGQLSAWRPYEGFIFSLLLSSHSTLTAEIYIDRLGKEGLVRAYDFIERYGDIISRLGAVEGWIAHPS